MPGPIKPVTSTRSPPTFFTMSVIMPTVVVTLILLASSYAAWVWGTAETSVEPISRANAKKWPHVITFSCYLVGSKVSPFRLDDRIDGFVARSVAHKMLQ